MNRNELVDAVTEQVGDRRLAATTVEAVLGTVTRAVARGERVALSGFGVFEKAERAARTARNPATGGTVQVAATAVPRFRPGQAFKDAVSGKRELPPPPAPAADFPPRVRRSAAASRSERSPVAAASADLSPATAGSVPAGDEPAGRSAGAKGERKGKVKDKAKGKQPKATKGAKDKPGAKAGKGKGASKSKGKAGR